MPRVSSPADIEQAFVDLAALESNWDSYQAQPPTQEAMAIARQFIKDAADAGLVPAKVGPTVMNGVFVLFARGARDVSVEFYNRGRHCSIFADDARENVETRYVDDPATWPGFFRAVSDYLA